MKKTISLIFGLVSLLVITSCSNAHKACAAYTHHETIDETPENSIRPLYKDLQ